MTASSWALIQVGQRWRLYTFAILPRMWSMMHAHHCAFLGLFWFETARCKLFELSVAAGHWCSDWSARPCRERKSHSCNTVCTQQRGHAFVTEQQSRLSTVDVLHLLDIYVLLLTNKLCSYLYSHPVNLVLIYKLFSLEFHISSLNYLCRFSFTRKVSQANMVYETPSIKSFQSVF